VSTASREIVLDFGEKKYFCGLYLDCHLAAAVTSVEKMPRIGDDTAFSEFYIVTVEAYSSRVAFDVPRDAIDPRLLVTDFPGPDRFLEALIIGDDDSLLHPRTMFRLL